MTISESTTIKCVAACNLIILFKFFATSIMQKNQRVLAPEDRSLGYKNTNTNANQNNAGSSVPPNPSSVVTVPNSATYNSTFDEMARWQRIVINDLENIPITIMMMWISYFISRDHLVTFIAAIIFTVSRYLHTFCYIFRLQPFRSIFWLLGLLCTWLLIGNIMWAAVHYVPPFPGRNLP